MKTVLALLLSVVAAQAADFKLLASGDHRVMILSATGAVEWEHPTKLTHDAWLLPTGNVLFADGESVTEVTRDHKVVFQYKSPVQKGGGTYACQRLANGNTVIGANSAGKILEVDPTGKIVFEMPTTPCTPGQHHNMRMARKLKNGNYLVCHSGAHIVKEYTPKGAVVLEIKTPNLAFSAVRTEHGTTIVGSLNKLLEYDATGKVVWEFANTDIPGVKITNMTGLHLLPNGHIVTGCYSAYDKSGEGTGLLEITRDKKLVWRIANPELGRSQMAVQKLDAEGKPFAGDCQR
jgi:outer membrane protein assembly factor BamB